MNTQLDLPTVYTKLYDKYYKQFADQVKYTIKNGTKSKIMDRIMRELSWNDQTALRAMVTYHSYEVASKNTGIDKRTLQKHYDIAVRHIYSPKYISMAVPKYYKLKNYNNAKELTAEDFYGKKYIVNALRNKSGIIYKEQLLKHLNNGWYFLCTLPGCGTGARMTILMSIDKWSGRGILNGN
jgi:hypothetical protein